MNEQSSAPRAAEETARYRTLLEINNALIANLTRDDLFRAIARAIRRVVPFDRTAIFLHDADKDVLKLFILESSLPSSYFDVGFEMAPGESHVGFVFQRQQALLRRDLGRERQYPAEDMAYRDGVRSYVVVPLIVRDRSIGALAVASTTPDRYSADDAQFLQEVANQVALAVENMKAYEEIATLKARLERENVYLQEEIRRDHNFVEMVGNSPTLLAVLRKVEQVATTDSTVLISGETGTGKELIARAIHSRSGRRERPLVKVNCAAMSAGLVESELFGHVKGAFTGATKFGRRIDTIAPATVERLVRYPWPGNIRELQNVIERATVLYDGAELELDQDLIPLAGGAAGSDSRKPTSAPVAPPAEPTSGAPLSQVPTLEQVERAHIEAVLEQLGGLIDGPNGAARVLAIHPNTLRSRMEKLGIKRPRHGIS